MVKLRNTLVGVGVLGTALGGTYEYRTRDRELPPAQLATRHLVRVEERALLLDGTKICELPGLQDQAKGAGTACKTRGKESDFYLDTLGGALPEPGRVGSLREAQITVDPRTPYRVLTELLFTLGQRGVELVAVSVPDGPRGDLLTYSYVMPSFKPGAGPSPVAVPRLVVTLKQAGISLRLETGTVVDTHVTRIGPGCAEGDGVTLPSSTPVDYGALVRCVFTLQGRVSARSVPSASLDEAQLSAGSEQPALSVLRVVSTLACGSETCLRTHLDGGVTLLARVVFAIPK